MRLPVSMQKKIFVTSDNPRFEEPEQIINDILQGMSEEALFEVEINRKEAIQKALIARKGEEIVLVLGKGDETYQTILDKNFPFDDREIIRELLSKF